MVQRWWWWWWKNAESLFLLYLHTHSECVFVGTFGDLENFELLPGISPAWTTKAHSNKAFRWSEGRANGRQTDWLKQMSTRRRNQHQAQIQPPLPLPFRLAFVLFLSLPHFSGIKILSFCFLCTAAQSKASTQCRCRKKVEEWRMKNEEVAALISISILLFFHF